MLQDFGCATLPHLLRTWQAWQEAELTPSAHACVGNIPIAAVTVQRDTHMGAAELSCPHAADATLEMQEAG